MKVILLKEVKGRGGEGDVIEVKDGFATNYLLKQGFAVKATDGALKQLEERSANIAKREEVRIAEANELQEKLNGIKFKVDVQIGDEGQLFGAVTSQMIADGIKKHAEVEIDKRRIDIRKAIKTVGLHKAEVVIYRDIKAEINVIVGDEDAEKFLEALKAKKEGKGAKKSGKKADKSDKNKNDENAKEETAAETKQAPAEDTPAEEVKAEDTPSEAAPVEEAPAEEATVEENKTEETSEPEPKETEASDAE